MPKLLTSTSKSRRRFTHLYPRDFKPASKGERKKQKKRGSNWHNHHHPRMKSTPNPNPNPKEPQANEGVYCTLLSLSLSLSLFPSPTSIAPIVTARQSICRCRLVNCAASPWYVSSLSAFLSLFLPFLSVGS
jgi:hypothetical protein